MYTDIGSGEYGYRVNSVRIRGQMCAGAGRTDGTHVEGAWNKVPETKLLMTCF